MRSAATATRTAIDPARLAAFFCPDSVAIVGATDRSAWSSTTFANWQTYCPEVPIHLVNPRHEIVHGQRTVASLRDIDGPVDLIFVMVGTEQVAPVLEEAATLGIRNALILTAGFTEAGPRGRELEQRIADIAAENDLIVLGPNAIGFINATARRPLAALPVGDLVAGPLGILLESGGLAASVLNMAQARAIGVSSLVSVGNQTCVTTADVLDYMVADNATAAIALFIESVREPERFRAAAGRALAAGKPIVALKVGRSAAGQASALAHTGAIAGDARVTRAAFASMGIEQVGSLEDLLTTAGFLSTRPGRLGPRTAVVTASGGACELIADRAGDIGLELTAFTPRIVDALSSQLPAFSTARNPLDVTGYVVMDPLLQVKALEAIAANADDRFDQIIYQTLSPKAFHGGQEVIVSRYERLASAITSAPIPVIVQIASGFDLTGAPAAVSQRFGLHMLDGIEHGMTAIGHALHWQQSRARLLAREAAAPASAVQRPVGAEGTWTEQAAGALLATHGVPVLTSQLVRSADEAVEVADLMGYPVVLKLAAPALAHKSDIGGVRLGLGDPGEVRLAADQLFETARRNSIAIVGLQVSPMRRDGVELLVSVRHDPTWGPVLAVGLGGIWVEVFDDTALAVLPVDADGVSELLAGLRAAPLLDGGRGRAQVDRAALVAAVLAIARLGEGLGDAIDTVEVNPVMAGPHGCEAVDALIVWRDQSATE